MIIIFIYFDSLYYILLILMILHLFIAALFDDDISPRLSLMHAYIYAIFTVSFFFVVIIFVLPLLAESHFIFHATAHLFISHIRFSDIYN